MVIAIPGVDDVTRTGFRAGSTNATVLQNLGLLAELPGEWRGEGFNVTARPFFGNTPPFFLELNATDETLDFTTISGDVPNRGSLQPDIELHGIRYVQHVIDKATDTGIHIEPGLWMRVPSTTSPAEPETYVRQASIPHGDSLVAQSTFTDTVNGGPVIQSVDTRPFTDATIPGLNATATQIVSKPGYLDQYESGTLPSGLPDGLTYQQTVQDPTLVLKAQIAKQKIINTVVIAISTAIPDPSNPSNIFNHLVNIPFVNKNANATQLDAIFWVEIVELPNGATFVQLQYVQRVILDFIGIHWPHISVATLKRF